MKDAKTTSGTIIIGIDPGSHCTGYGIIRHQSGQSHFVDCGQISPPKHHTAKRLHYIYQNIASIVKQHQPTSAAIEQIFTHINPQSALKLGQARGAALIALAEHQLNPAEYSARQVKQASVGYGAASKNQVQQMIKTLLKLAKLPATDAADALAIALCHAQYHSFNAKVAAATQGD
ncbi:MAG: crossover junction endodeoxyribonuclease RuvC [Gammaproteobacteria bacterium]|nr:crossover junction endodeoxyribonuclease RuvC [Gammaproteobacteria bacterium]